MFKAPGPFDHDETSQNSYFSPYQNNGVKLKHYFKRPILIKTWVQQVMIISDDTRWSYLYIQGVEIGFKIWKLEPDVSERSKFIILSTFLTAIRRVLRICPAIRRLTCWTALEYT